MERLKINASYFKYRAHACNILPASQRRRAEFDVVDRCWEKKTDKFTGKFTVDGRRYSRLCSLYTRLNITGMLEIIDRSVSILVEILGNGRFRLADSTDCSKASKERKQEGIKIENGIKRQGKKVEEGQGRSSLSVIRNENVQRRKKKRRLVLVDRVWSVIVLASERRRVVASGGHCISSRQVRSGILKSINHN